MSIIITSDTHFTNNPLDEYRWALWPWLRKMVVAHEVTALLHLGDLTDAKDRHEATLVNRLVDELKATAKRVPALLLVKANHDFINENTPFFGFTRHLKDITYVSEPLLTEIEGMNVAVLPHTKDYQNEWEGLDLKSCHYIFCHQTFDGSKAENGSELRGIPPSYFDNLPKSCKVISGDIHVPQMVGKRIMYVGSPYRVHFGDAFLPRVLLIEDDCWTNLHFPCPSREVIDVTSSRKFMYGDFPKGTQVKVRVHLKRQEFGEKDAIRADIRKATELRGWELCGMEFKLIQAKNIDVSDDLEKAQSPVGIVKAYAKSKKLSKEVGALGVSFVKEAAK